MVRPFGTKSTVVKILCSLLPLCAFLFACSSMSGYNKMKAFDETARSYKYAMIASDLEAAERFARDFDTIFDEMDLEAYRNIRVVSYEVKGIMVSEDKMTVRQEVELWYYRISTMIQKTVRAQEEWVYKPENKRWVLKSGLPAF